MKDTKNNDNPLNIISVNNGYKKISFKPGPSLLVSLAKEGIYVPSACGGNGRCGYCKVKVTSGNTDPYPQELLLLRPDEVADGWRLSCQFKPQQSLSIEIPQKIFSVKRFSGKLEKKTQLTPTIMGLRIELTTPKTLEYISGQYIQFKSPEYEGKPAVLRCFSIASSPSDSNHIELMVRHVPNGICTSWIFNHLKEGDPVYGFGPQGDFHLSDTNSPLLFIAGGSGMAPVWSMLQYMRENGLKRKVIFFFGALSQEDLFYQDEIARMKNDLSDFTFIPALSNEPAQSQWMGERGLITEVVKRLVKQHDGFEAYLCGSAGMIDACCKVLAEIGFDEKKTYYDKFV